MRVMDLFKWEKPDFHPIAWGIITGTLLSRFVFFMSMPFLAIFLDRVKGLDSLTIGLIIGVSALVGTFFGFFGGGLSDRLGRFPVMLLSISVWVLVFIGYAVAESPLVFFLLSALNGLCRASFEPTGQALLADVTPKEKRMSVYNARYTAINLGAAFGPLLGVYLGSADSTAPFFITAAVYGIYGLIVLGLFIRYGREFSRSQSGESVTLREAFRVVASDRMFRYFLIGGILANAVYANMESTLPQYLGNAPGIENGMVIYSYLLVTNAVSVLIMQYPLTRFFKQYHPLAAVKTGSILFGLGMFGFGLFESSFLLLFSMIVLTAGEILVFLMSNLLIDRMAPAEIRGSYFGAAGFRGLGFSLGPAFGGYLLSVFGYDQGTLVFGLIMGLSIVSIPLFNRGQALEQGRIDASA